MCKAKTTPNITASGHPLEDLKLACPAAATARVLLDVA